MSHFAHCKICQVEIFSDIHAFKRFKEQHGSCVSDNLHRELVSAHAQRETEFHDELLHCLSGNFTMGQSESIIRLVKLLINKEESP